MTHRSILIDRRQFIAAAGMTALAAKASLASSRSAFTSSLAFAASRDKLTVYRTREAKWIPTQTVSSEAPVSLVADRSTQTLHVLHAVSEYRGLPSGYIESFRVDPHHGQLQLLAKQPLSLSGVQPTSMALSPDGKALAVAIGGGAAYNLLPILEDGQPGRPRAIRKEIGVSSTLPSRPSHLVFSRGGDRIFALDQGASTLSVFTAADDLQVLSRLSFPRAGRYISFASYGDEDLIFAIDRATGSLLSIRHDPADGRLSCLPEVIRGNFLGPIAIHASSRTLFVIAADGMDVFRIQASTGQLSPIQRLGGMPSFHGAQQLVCDSERHSLYLAAENGIFASSIDPDGGRLLAFACVAPQAQRMTLL